VAGKSDPDHRVSKTRPRQAAETKGPGGYGALLLVGGALVLLFCLAGGGAVGVWYWNKPAGGKPAEGGVVKGPDGKGNAPQEEVDAPRRALGKAPLTDLDPAFALWDFTIRVPKGMELTNNDRPGGGPGDARSYSWRFSTADGVLTVVKQSSGAGMDPLLALSANRKLESKPNAPITFSTIHKPHAVEINGLRGARMWQLYPGQTTLPIHPEEIRVGIQIEYRFDVDGRVYYFTAIGQGKTEAAARAKADVLDVSICTFSKR
jgi:hypothetical protein